MAFGQILVGLNRSTIQILEMSDLYARLGVGRNATTEEIRKGYKDLAKQKHPDRGGNAEEFKAIQEAHEVLCDEGRRKIYDMTGQVNEQQGGHAGGMAAGGVPFHFMNGMGPFGMPGVSFNMGDVFGQMFGGGPARKQRQPRGPNKHHDVGLRLADFFKGRDINLKFNQARRCTGCKGTGSESSEQCGTCNGAGVRTTIRQIGPGMMAQTRSPCDVCSGEGTRTIRACRLCNSKTFNEREKQLDIKIKPGMREGELLTFAGECSDGPEFEAPGDVILTLKRITEEDDKYVWRGDDLWIQKTIAYSESVLGFRFKLDDHPNGLSPEFVWRGGPLIHGAVLQIAELGMPKKAGGLGILFVQVMITPPELKPWSSEDAAKLQAILGGSSASMDESVCQTLLISSSASKLVVDRG